MYALARFGLVETPGVQKAAGYLAGLVRDNGWPCVVSAELGKFTLESVWTAWKDWEFGQKKIPSRWLTLLAWRILRRVESC